MGCPVTGKLQWTVPLAVPRPSCSVIFDVNEDGNADVITAADSGKVQAFNGIDGSLLWLAEYSSNTCASTPQMVSLSSSKALYCLYATASELLVIAGSDGKILGSFNIAGDLGVEPLVTQVTDSSACLIWSSFQETLAFDLPSCSLVWSSDQCGISYFGHPSEFHTNDSTYSLYNCFRNDSVFAVARNSETGSLLWESYLSPFCLITTPGIVSLDHNGDGEEGILSCFGTGSVALLHPSTGETIWSVQYDSTLIFAEPIIYDIDRDNSMEILVCLYEQCCISILDESGEEEGRIDLRGEPLRSPVFSDLNNDGVCEIILSCGIMKGNIQIFDGTTLEEIAYIGHSHAVPSGVEITDLNNDGEPELLYSSIGGRLFVLPVSSVL